MSSGCVDRAGLEYHTVGPDGRCPCGRWAGFSRSDQRSDGVPAFPGVESPGGGYAGMLLRDYFAAAAMGGIVRCTNGLWNESQAAQQAYVYADAMLKAREAK